MLNIVPNPTLLSRIMQHDEFNFINQPQFHISLRRNYLAFSGHLTNLEKEVSVDSTNSEQVSEIKQIQWVTKEEALKNIRDYHSTRRKVINTIFKFIDHLDNYIII